MYQRCTWMLSILWAVVCSQDFSAIGWLSAGYWLAMYQDQYTSRHCHILCTKWHLAAINTLDCSVLTRFLAICWLSAGYWLAILQNQYTSRHSHMLLHTNFVNGCRQYFGL